MRVVPLEAFRDRIPFAVAVNAVERGFRALGLGEATLPDPMVVELAEQQAEVHVKGAHLRGARHIVLKVATGFYRNRARGLPSGDGMFLLLDAETGVPDVLLEEHGYLTDLRTAAAVALTLKYLAPPDARDALLVGAGALARVTARAVLAETPLERLTLWNRSPARAEALARELRPLVETRVAPALERAVREHPVVVTATATCGTPWPRAPSRGARCTPSCETWRRGGSPGARARASSRWLTSREWACKTPPSRRPWWRRCACDGAASAPAVSARRFPGVHTGGPPAAAAAPLVAVLRGRVSRAQPRAAARTGDGCPLPRPRLAADTRARLPAVAALRLARRRGRPGDGNGAVHVHPAVGGAESRGRGLARHGADLHGVRHHRDRGRVAVRAAARLLLPGHPRGARGRDQPGRRRDAPRDQQRAGYDPGGGRAARAGRGAHPPRRQAIAAEHPHHDAPHPRQRRSPRQPDARPGDGVCRGGGHDRFVTIGSSVIRRPSSVTSD